MLKQLLDLLGYVPRGDYEAERARAEFFRIAMETQNGRLQSLIDYTHKLRTLRPEEMPALWN